MSSDIPERCTARALVSGCVSKGLLVATKYINEDNNKQNSLLLNFHPNRITFQFLHVEQFIYIFNNILV